MKNTLLLAGSSIILRLCALCFQAYLAAKVGSEQLGIFGIISSVGIVFATISISGVRFGVTRLASEAVSSGNKYPYALMRCAFLYAGFFGMAAGGIMYFAAPVISRYWVMNTSVSGAIRIMALSMPLIAFGAAAEGYFTAKQKIFRLVVTELMAQLLRMGFVAVCFKAYLHDKASSARILAGGSLVGESVLALGMLVMYVFESRAGRERISDKGNMGRLVKTSFPLAVSAYMRTGLSSLGQIIIPRGLRSAGMGAASAFSTYGVITQMSMPVIMFPAALLSALGEILVPRLTGAQVMGHKIGISYIVNRALRIGVIFSFGVAGAMMFYSQMLGEAIYNSVEAGFYIKIFAPIIPIIYIDCVTDGCLKGLDQQLHSMMYNVMEGALNVVLLLILLPRTAIMGYIAVMYIKEIFNALLSLRRLSMVTAVDSGVKTMICVALAVCGAYMCTNLTVPQAGLVSSLVFYTGFYVALLYILSAVTRDDLKWAVSLMNPKKI